MDRVARPVVTLAAPIYPGGELKRLLLEKPLEVSPPEKVKADA